MHEERCEAIIFFQINIYFIEIIIVKDKYKKLSIKSNIFLLLTIL